MRFSLDGRFKKQRNGKDERKGRKEGTESVHAATSPRPGSLATRVPCQHLQDICAGGFGCAAARQTSRRPPPVAVGARKRGPIFQSIKKKKGNTLVSLLLPHKMKRQRRARYNVQRSLSRGGFFEWLLSTFPKGLGKAESDLSRNKPKGRCISFLFFFFFLLPRDGCSRGHFCELCAGLPCATFLCVAFFIFRIAGRVCFSSFFFFLVTMSLVSFV